MKSLNCVKSFFSSVQISKRNGKKVKFMNYILNIIYNIINSVEKVLSNVGTYRIHITV